MTKDRTILIKNIYYMLSYAFTILRKEEYEKVAAENFDNLHSLFAAILAAGVGRQLKQGLYREYISRHETMPGLRGKIDMTETVRLIMGQKKLIACEFDDFSENNLLNQILKTVMELLLKHAEVKAEQKAELRKELLFFSEVDYTDLTAVRWQSIQFQRNNAAYRMLISLCQLITEGMLQTTEEGTFHLASFMDEQRMSRLYEKFILEYYIREHPEIRASASQISWALDDGVGTLLPVMQSDIMLQKGNRVLIIDAKYYGHTMQTNYDVKTIHSANLYQIFTYVKNKEEEMKSLSGHQTAGMLLYARTDEELQPEGDYQMSGNRISVRTLDLNQEFSSIAAQLDAITEDFFAG